jgi:hypothetical protein
MLDRKRAMFVAGGAVVAAALFGSGMLAANAIGDHGSGPLDHVSTGDEIARTGGAVPAIGMNTTSQSGGASAGKGLPSIAPLPTDAIYGTGGCGNPITAAVSGTTLDPAKMDFAPRMLAAGFTLTGMAFASQGACDGSGGVTNAHLVFRTEWMTADGVGVAVTQQQGVDPGTPNFIQQSNATFVSGGYAFAVWANGAMPIPVDKVAPDGNAGGTQSSPASRPAAPLTSGDAQKALEAAVGQLAPEIGLQCFWRQVQGSWGDLPLIGAGDPRGVIPAGFTEQGMQLMRFQGPAAGCETTTSAPFAGQANFYAMFSNSSGGQIYLNVTGGVEPGASQPGRVDDNSASWSDHGLFFSVNANGSGTSRDVVTAIARALDPGFGNVCLMTSRKPTDDDLAKLSIHAPKAPSGYKLDQAQLTAADGSAACGGSNTGFAAVWMFVNTDKGGYIEAGVTGGTSQFPEYYGNVTPTSLVWHDAAGNAYHVSSLKAEVDRDVLLGVAKSMDPNFSESRLEAPPVNGGVTGGGSGSSGGGGTNAVPPVAPAKPD